MRMLTIVGVMTAAFALASGCERPTTAPADAPSSPAWRLTSTDGAPVLRNEAAGLALSCRDGRLSVTVDAFHVVASEERMSLGAGETVTALVVGVTGAPAPSVVTGVAPLAGGPSLILSSGEPLGVNYGYQNAGPITSAPHDQVAAFLQACGPA